MNVFQHFLSGEVCSVLHGPEAAWYFALPLKMGICLTSQRENEAVAYHSYRVKNKPL